MLNQGAGRAQMTSWLRAAHADWHEGETWGPGSMYVGFGDYSQQCTRRCKASLQVGFRRGASLCTAFFDVITVQFYPNGKLRSWKRDDAGSAC